MNKQLLNVKQLFGFSKKMLSQLDEMNSGNDLQLPEAFDIVGILAKVLSGEFTRCEDFVQAPINAKEKLKIMLCLPFNIQRLTSYSKGL